MRRGVSLIEVLITLGVLALALGMVAAAVQQYSRLLIKNDQRSLTVVHQQQVSQVADELSQAVQFLLPATSVSVDEVTFERLNGSILNRLPPLTPTPLPSPAWEPVQPAHVIRVRYFFEPTTSRLLRTATFPAPTGSVTTVVATGLSGFTFTRSAQNELTVALSFMEGETLKSISTRVTWWLRWP